MIVWINYSFTPLNLAFLSETNNLDIQMIFIVSYLPYEICFGFGKALQYTWHEKFSLAYLDRFKCTNC